MKNSIGSNVILSLFGESHGPAIGAVLDGLAPGLRVDPASIAERLSRRRPNGTTDTSRIEEDQFRILSGVLDSRTTGTPITIVIPNENTRSKDYEPFLDIARPSHADYAAQMKYHGFQDKRGGGHFSGRLTAAIVAAGAICADALAAKGIGIATHILSCGGINDRDCLDSSDIELINSRNFPVIDENAARLMEEKILEAKAEGDSLGGIIQTMIAGLPAGLGEPCFDSLESLISHAVFSIGGIKGIEFGAGFRFADMKGSQANDPFEIKDGKIYSTSNNSGGINGGISNAMPVVFNMAVRPTPSISKTQASVDYVKGENVNVELKGRHDPAIIRRVCIVVSSLVAVVLCDVLSGRYGTDWLAE